MDDDAKPVFVAPDMSKAVVSTLIKKPDCLPRALLGTAITRNDVDEDRVTS